MSLAVADSLAMSTLIRVKAASVRSAACGAVQSWSAELFG